MGTRRQVRPAAARLGPTASPASSVSRQKGPNLGAATRAGLNVWPVGHIRVKARERGEALDVLTGRLQMLGIVRQVDLDAKGLSYGYGLTPFGLACITDPARLAN
jgi:hypothetical protein